MSKVIEEHLMLCYCQFQGHLTVSQFKVQPQNIEKNHFYGKFTCLLFLYRKFSVPFIKYNSFVFSYKVIKFKRYRSSL